jgi:hypothetical protein
MQMGIFIQENSETAKRMVKGITNGRMANFTMVIGTKVKKMAMENGNLMKVRLIMALGKKE